MRIGIDARLWRQTGVGRYIQNLVIGLLETDNNNQYVLFCLEEDKKNIEELLRLCTKSKLHPIKKRNLKIVPVNIRWHSIAEQIKFPKIIASENPDIMHFTYFSVPILYKKKYVMTMHDLITHQVPTGRASTLPMPIYSAKRVAYKMIVGQALKNAQKIIVPTYAVREELITSENLSAEKIIVTHEGTSFNDSKIKIRKLNKDFDSNHSKKVYRLLSEKVLYFLYVGNAYPHKNLERLIEAFQLLIKNSQYKDIKLILVGKKDYFSKLLENEIKNKKLHKNIIFTGFISDTDLKSLYQNAVALIAPALLEGFGLPPLEAMSSGCLVAASKIPVLLEVCGKAAIYFNPEDTENIRKILQKILKQSQEDRATYIRLGREQSKIFSWSHMVKKTLQIYEDCARI